MSSKPTSHRQNLTRERAKLRALHHEPRPRDEIEYRGHTIKREPADKTMCGCYRIIKNDEFIDAVEPRDFYNTDDFVRYVDLVVQQGREAAQEWRDTELTWNPDDAQYQADRGVDELDEHIITNRSTSAKKKHRPADPETDEPACDAPLHNGDWVRKSSSHTVFYDACSNPECFGGDDE